MYEDAKQYFRFLLVDEQQLEKSELFTDIQKKRNEGIKEALESILKEHWKNIFLLVMADDYLKQKGIDYSRRIRSINQESGIRKRKGREG